MILRIDHRSEIGIVDQIVTQIARSVRSGDLDPGERLPTVRQLAADLGVAPGTVAKAYTALESVGVVQSNGRRGTKVAATADLPRLDSGEVSAVPATVADAAARLASLARAAGMSEDDVLRLVREAHRSHSIPASRA